MRQRVLRKEGMKESKKEKKKSFKMLKDYTNVSLPLMDHF